MESPFVPEVLLHHGQFVRALARSLLRDTHAADDVAQDTWTRYVEHGPAGERGLRHWLRVVTRNLAANVGRGAERRAARDRAAARAEALPSAQEELEHAELLGVVVEAVLALEEPYRDTIVARYYRGLDAAAIAARSGTTAATVRSREHRALELLRARLDRRFPGERGAWAAVLARLAGRPVGEVAGSPAGWPVALTAAIPVLAAAAGVVFWLRSREPAPVRLAQAPAAGVALAGLLPRAPLEPPVLAPGSRPAEQRTPAAGEPAGSASLTNAALAEVHGRFVFPGGAPAEGASIRMHGWGANQERVLQFGKPSDWVDPEAACDAEGRFSVRFDPPRAFQFALAATAPGHAEASWRWGEILPGATLDLGEIELPVGGAIQGRMVDAQGNALAGEPWRIYARTNGLGKLDGLGARDESQVAAPADAAGSFRLEGVWPCEVKLQAYSRIASWVDGPAVVVRPGETVTADIVYPGPSNADRITVVTFCEPFPTQSNPEPGHIRLLGPSGETRVAQRIEGSSQSHSFDHLAPGSYTVEIDDPRYLPWSRAGVTPGESVTANLVASAALRLSVVDAAGQPVEVYGVRVTLRSSASRPNEFALHDGATPLPGGLLGGMAPGDYTVAVRCADGTTGRCEVDGLASGETRDVRLELGSQLFVAGRVVHPGGRGVAGAAVLLLTPAERDDSDASPVLERGTGTNDTSAWRREIARTETGADGAFHFDATSAGPFLLRARSEGSQAFSPPFTLEAARPELELVLPVPGSVRGRVRAPKDGSLEGLALWIAPRALWDSPQQGPANLQRVHDAGESLARALAPLGADGSFELTRLPPGPSRAFLVIREYVAGGFSLVGDGIDGAEVLGELTVPPGIVLKHDFEAKELPGRLTLEVRVNGATASFLAVSLRRKDEPCGRDVSGRTDAAGRFGPERLPSGSWSVWAADSEAGWGGWVEKPVLVEPTRETHALIDVLVAGGALTCVDAAGQPIASDWVIVLRGSEPVTGAALEWLPATSVKTDANGRLVLQLMPGEYGLVRGSHDARARPQPTATLTWTATGPLVERVQL